MNNGRWKVKIPIILTITDVCMCLMPVVLFGIGLIIGSSPSDLIDGLCGISFVVLFIFFVIGVFVVPCEQFALIIWAIATKKRWLLGIHIPFTVISTIECIVVVYFLHCISMQ